MLMREITAVSRMLKELTKADKINVEAIGKLRRSYMSTLWRAMRPIANGLTGYSGAILNPIRRRSANHSCLSSGLA